MKKRWMSGTLALLLAGTTVASMMPAVSVKAEGNTATGTTYYVDSNGGNDSNEGTSEGKAFRTLDKVNTLDLEPGDTVLLKRGSVFEDQALKFTKEDSGTAEAPVRISAYGEGNRPQINTNGHGQWELNYGTPLDNQNHKWKGTVSSSILIEDTEYIEIEGLELTNDRNSASDTEKDKAYNNAYAMDRTGVAGVAKDNGTVDHIVLNDLYIHDVTGNVYNKHMTNGGIYFIVAKPTNEGATGIARYNDVKITNCSLDTVNRWGIAVGYTYQWRQFETAELPDAMMAKYGSSNVVIENNYLNNVGGDAITTMYLDRPMVQYNVSENAAKQINTKDYIEQQPRLDANGNEVGKQAVGAGRVAAGIWPWKCKNAIFQYNECFSTLNASNGNGDGQPWDADYGDGTNYQYNYSHGNTASTIMFCYDNSVNNTFRYNISQNEDMGPLDPARNSGNCQVYNNTFYIKEGLTSIWSTAHANNGPVNMENNIFYFAGDKPAKTGNSWNPNGNKTYSNNLYYNVETYPDDAAPVKVDAGTQVLVNPGSGPYSVATDKAARKHENPTEKTVFDGYKLAENSPAINAGKVVVDRNGYTIDHDFFGHAITAVPEIGAAESDAVVALVLRSNVYTVSERNVSDLPKNTTVEDFLKNVIIDAGVTVTIKDGEKELTATDIVKGGATITLSYEGMESVTYTVVASSDKELKDCYYEVKGTTMSVPYTDNNPATVKEVKANITVADTATVSVLNGENELADTNNVAAGMILRITAENGDTNDYIIAQKNTYNWTLDYINGQQGNVWFGQIKDGSGDWANMTAVDKDGWPNWATHTYYGPGIDAPRGTITTTNPSVHGLLSAPPSTDISTAMAYRVPKSGTVTFNVKDDEPYLRQSGNANGTVTLGLFVNDTEKESVTLVNSQEKVGEWEKPVELEVAQGDIIRVVAKCSENPTKPSAHITPIITYVDKAAADKEAPTVPADVKATEVTETTAKITWSGSTDNVSVAGYNVYVNETKVNDALVTGTEYSLTDLTAATEYRVTVTAVDAAENESAKSEAAVFTTEAPKNTEAPTAPTEVTVTDVTATAAKVTWKAPADNDSVVGYKVYLNNVQVNKELVTTTEYDLSELKETTDYSVTVCSVNAAGKESEKSAEATFTTQKTEEPIDTVKPSVPGNVVVPEDSITQTGATITWEASTDNVAVTGYNVYVGETRVNATPVTVTTYNLTGLTAGTQYAVTVTAVDAAGNESAGSEQATFTTLAADETKDSVAPSVPGNVVVPETSITQTGAKITWEASEDDTAVVGYNVYVNEAKVNTDGLVDGLELELTGLTPDTEYTVTVTAVDAERNESGRSAAFTFTTLKNEEPAPEKPSAPINVKVTDIKWRTAKVTWEAAPERAAVKKYNVYLNDVKVKSTDETECLLENLTGDTLYAVAVTAMAEDGTESDKAVLEEVIEEGIEKGKFKTQVDKEELQETAKNVDKVLENKENYTEESLKNLQDAYNNCQKVLEDKNATLDQVEEAKKALKKAYDNLKTKDDDKKDDGKKDDGKQDDGKQDDGKKEDPKKDPTPTPGPATPTPTPTTTPTPSTTPQSGAKPAAPSGTTNTGSTGASRTTTGSTSATRAAKTGDTANAAAWLFTLAASAVAGTVIVKRKRED